MARKNEAAGHHNWDEEQRLTELFALYREACEEPEPGALFVPGIWNQIESRGRVMVSLRRWTSAFVTAAAAACIVMAAFLHIPQSEESPVYLTTYVETLASGISFEELAYAEVTGPDLVAQADIP